jgi:hypothetical protein
MEKDIIKVIHHLKRRENIHMPFLGGLLMEKLHN